MPVRVRHAGGNQLMLQPLDNMRNAKEIVIDSSDNKLDISSVPLGFVRVSKTHVVYVSRRPARIYKQGLSQEAIVVDHISKESRALHPVVDIYSQSFADMILNRYPPILVVLDGLEKINQPIEVAVSRDIAIRYDNDLKISYVYFKTDRVGFIVGGTKKVIIPNSEKAWVITNYLHELNWEVE